jgi:hypothetical protein
MPPHTAKPAGARAHRAPRSEDLLDKSHVCDQHIPELRQLVQLRSAEEPPDSRDAPVGGGRYVEADGCPAGDHRTGLVQRVRQSGTLADPTLRGPSTCQPPLDSCLLRFALPLRVTAALRCPG